MSNISVIFDMDGVLIDSVKYHWQAMNEVLSDYGISVPDKQLPKYIGRPLRSQLEQLGNENDVELDYDILNHKISVIKQALLENIQPKEGVIQLLELLKTNNVPIAIATSNTRDETDRRLIVAGIRDYFSVLVTEDDVTEHKPNPAVYLEAARQLGANPKDCIVFEDAPAGVRAAKGAGMTCVAIQTPFTNATDLQAADTVVTSLLQVDMDVISNVIV